MFFIGEHIRDPLTGLTVEVTGATEHTITVRYPNSLSERTDRVSSHVRTKLLFMDALDGSIVHTQLSERIHLFHLATTSIRARWTGKQWHWAINGKPSTQTKVWNYLYGGN